MIQPAQMYAWLGFLEAHGYQVPAAAISKNALLAGVRNTKNVIQWRAVAVRRLGLTPAQALQFGSRNAMFQELFQQSPFQ